MGNNKKVLKELMFSLWPLGYENKVSGCGKYINQTAIY